MRKVILIGLDCAAPELVFERFKGKLPNLSRLMTKGQYGKLESSDPAITIPAWMVMVTSRTPGELGLYGFRHRKGSSYKEGWIANTTRVNTKKIWDHVADAGGKVCLIAIPPSYPPYKVNGDLVGCFITPDTSRQYTHPPELADEIKKVVGEYVIDVEFRIDEKEETLKAIYNMTEKRFQLAKYLIRTRDWQFFMLVEIGLDRIHHAFWRYFDKEHHLYEPGNRYEKVIEDYYIFLDRKVGEVLELLDDDTVVLVTSDHGAKRMKGCFCINSWLIQEGLLKLKKLPEKAIPFSEDDVDWDNTVAWGWGGYYARIFLNVKGREAQGKVNPEDYERTRDHLVSKIKGIRGPSGEKWETQVMKPEEIYPETHGDKPDLMVYFDDLYWRSAGSIGHMNQYLPENDTGPDDCVHAKQGIYILHDPKNPARGKVIDAKIYDVAPTVLSIMGLKIPPEMEGKPLIE